MAIRRILVLYKKSIYQWLQEKSRSPQADAPIGDIARFEVTHRRHQETLTQVLKALTRHAVAFDAYERDTLTDYSDYDRVVTVGGDGTFLEAARFSTNQILLGINSDPEWSVGRLCAADPGSLDRALADMLSERAQPSALTRLDIACPHLGAHFFALNDVLIVHQNPAALSRYRIEIADIGEEHRNSGLWVATAAGSTGAIHSAGGRPLPLVSRSIQYMPRELYSDWKNQPYALRGGVLETDNISITSLMDGGAFFIDGAHQHYPLPLDAELHITRSDKPLYVILKTSSPTQH